MQLHNVQRVILEPAMCLLPPEMSSKPAFQLLITIGLQESGFRSRVQNGGGPARGFWQFENAGTLGVLNHPSTSKLAIAICNELCYSPDTVTLKSGIQNNDVLAAAFARLLLWTHPKPLPTNERDAWQYYLDTWRPGKPRQYAWAEYYQQVE